MGAVTDLPLQDLPGFQMCSRGRVILLLAQKVEYHVGDSDLCVGVCSWFWGLEWQLAAAPSVCLYMSNAASGGKVGKRNSYLPARAAQTPTHSCSPHSQQHTQHLSACAPVSVCVPGRLHTRTDLYYRACEYGNLCCFSIPALASASARQILL